MKTLRQITILCLLILVIESCSKDDNEIIEPTLTEADQKTINYFKEIALGFEFDDVNYPEVTRRWKEDLVIFIGGEQPNELIQELNKIIAEINALVTNGFNISITSNRLQSNYYLFLGSHTDYIQQYPGDSNLASSNYGLFIVGWDDDNNFYNGRMYVDTQRADLAAQKHLLREELTQSLGLAKDSNKYPNSIFQSAWTTTDSYLEIDKKLIELLYHPNMQTGLDANKVEKILESILLSEQ
jgi:hypothetical protein